MRRNLSTSQPQRSSRRVRYANERRKSVGQRQRPRLSPSFSLNKDALFNFYALVILGPVLLVVAGFVAFFAHDIALPAIFTFVTNSTRDGILQMWKRPTLIIAFLFVLSLWWCMSDGGTSASNPNLRRGRDVGGLNRARKLGRDHSQKSRRSQSQRRN